MHVHTYTHTYTCTHTHTHTHTNRHKIHIHTHMHTQIHRHTHKHAHIHIHTLSVWYKLRLHVFMGVETGLADLGAVGPKFLVIIILKIVTNICNQTNKKFYHTYNNAYYCFTKAFALLLIEFYMEKQSYKPFRNNNFALKLSAFKINYYLF